jgi:hypothetical protein
MIDLMAVKAAMTDEQAIEKFDRFIATGQKGWADPLTLAALMRVRDMITTPAPLDVDAVRSRFQAAFPAGVMVGRDLLMTKERIRSLNDIEDLFSALATPAPLDVPHRYGDHGWCVEQHTPKPDAATPAPLDDEPVARLRRALGEHPNATYVRVERIDLAAALAATPAPLNVERLAVEYAQRLYDDLAFAAPELWLFKMQVRISQAIAAVLE